MVFEFLADLPNHWQLSPHFLELEGMEADGGHVRVKGPLGLSRVAETLVTSTEQPRLLTGTAAIGTRTVGHVRWDVTPVPGGSHVRFAAEVDRASLADRVLLVAGGRWWLDRIIRAAVARLEEVIGAPR